MRLRSIVAALAGALLFGVGATAQTPTETKPKAQVAAPTTPVTPTPAPVLDKTDVDGFLDGFMPYAISSGDVAGAVVVVVKDGQILTEKGYGFADIKSGRKVDPKLTLFRPGSVSKLFVWTAVMQQVEQGKIDLDADINKYLDFKIPPYQGQPITMRDLMTHTPGFAEWGKSLFVGSKDRIIPLGDLLKRWTPKRIYAPGTTPAYSNYGASLAGYIVQRVSGQSFDDYMDQHIFKVLDDHSSTFRQPLPAQYVANMATAYPQASKPAKPYEIVAGEPAGSSSMAGDDIAHFMIAHLNNGSYNGQQLLKPATVVQMHTMQKQLNPPLDAMALGFWHEDRNGHSIVNHGGDTAYFHSDLSLLDHDNVGLFISMNSAGKEGAAGRIRTALLHGFVDRYFPAAGPKTVLPTTSTAKAHAAQMAGVYWASRRADSTVEAGMNFMSQLDVKANPDGTLTIAALKNVAGAPKKWREIGDYVWTDSDNESRLAAVVKDGKVVNFISSDIPPIMVFQPVPAWASKSWNHPLLGLTLGILALTVILWPVHVLVRRKYGTPFKLSGEPAMLYRATRVAAIVQLVAFVVWVCIFATISLYNSDGSRDGLMHFAQFLTLLACIGSAAQVWNAVVTLGDRARGWWAKTSAVLIALAGLAYVWFSIVLHFLSWSVMY